MRAKHLGGNLVDIQTGVAYRRRSVFILGEGGKIICVAKIGRRVQQGWVRAGIGGVG